MFAVQTSKGCARLRTGRVNVEVGFQKRVVESIHLDRLLYLLALQATEQRLHELTCLTVRLRQLIAIRHSCIH
jgi:hypothetical protein